MTQMQRQATLWVAAIIVLTGTASFAQTAHYQATFDATWTAETHPGNYPPSPHFSGMVGGTHDASVSFWEDGVLASLGIKRMAEWGNQVELLDEVQAAIDLGQAEFTIVDSPLWTVPGSTSVNISLNPDFPLVTMVAMIAPSPDWFVGVKGLDLMSGGQWADELVVELFPWDSGTDSGANYTSGDNPSMPPVPVFPITGGPFSPGVPIGTLTFTKLYVSSVPNVPGFAVSAYPNPFNPQTTISWELPAAGRLSVEVFDVKGRRIRTLWNRETSAGSGQVTWNGRSDANRRVNSGQYFCLIRQDDSQITKRLMLIQ